MGFDSGYRSGDAEKHAGTHAGELAGTPVLVIGTHFAGATAARIVRDGEYRLDL